MESLYRKYRPQTFDDVVGQRHVVETLEHAVIEGRTSHAYLFCGPRGTGKTTMARLLAKALLCEHGPGKLPDGTCESCQLIAEGRHPDVYELDAASRTGVDNVREEIINRVGYAPVRGHYKVYIIDEVHMLTTAAFNALLKTLEEPPEHIVFVLCTTDPQKIPATILSRVQRFDFRAISGEDIHARLVHVCEREGFSYDEAALDLIVRHARGGLRDALSTLEQLSVFGDGDIGVEATRDLLGEASGSALAQVSEALAARDVATLFGEVAKLVDAGRDLLQFVRELAAHMRDVYVIAAVGPRPGVVQADSQQVEALSREASGFGSSDRVARVLAILGEASSEMRTATNQRLVLEIALTRMARPEGDLTLESLAERVDRLERGATAAQGATGPRRDDAGRETSWQAPASRQAQPAREPSSREASRARPEQAGRPEPPASPVRRQPPASPRTEQRPSGRQGAPVGDAGQLQRSWKQVVDTLVRTAASRGSLLMSSTIVSDDGTTIVVQLPKGSAFALRMLERQDVRATVEPVVGQVFGRRQLRFEEAGGAKADPRGGAGHAQGSARERTRPRSGGRRSPSPTRAPETAAGHTEDTPASAPMPTQEPARPVYEMPWDGPAEGPAARPVAGPSAPQEPPQRGQGAAHQPTPMPPAPEEAPYEEVPYDDLSASVYGDDASEAGDGSPVPAPDHDASAPSSPTQQREAPAERREDGAPAPDAVPFADIPDDVPADLTAIIESAFDVFGAGVKVSRVSKGAKPTKSGETGEEKA